MDGVLAADLTFDFTGIDSPAALEARLLNLRARGHTAETLPGRLVEKLPDLLAAPAPTYDYAETAFFLAADAAENILNAAIDWPEKIIATILHHRIQFIGMAREHHLYTIREHMYAERLDTLPNCTGISPAGFGLRTDPPYTVERNVATMRTILRRGGLCLQRTLALIRPDDTPDRRLSQHELRYWIGGADLPATQRIPVEICRRNGRLDIGPAGDDKLRLVQMGWTMPVYSVPKGTISTASPAAAHIQRPTWAAGMEGARYAVAKDFRAYFDKREGKEYPIETENARFALRILLKIAHGRKNARPAAEIEQQLSAGREAARLRPAPTLELVHYFQTKVGGNRITLPVYAALVHNLKGQGLYWVDL